MKVAMTPAQTGIRNRFAELVDAELVPVIRRMGEQPGPAAAQGDSGDGADTATARASFWRALVDLGAVRLLLPERHGGENAGQQGAVLLAELLGTALYQGPLLDTWLAVELLLDSPGTEAARIAEVADGAGIAVALRATAGDGYDRPAPIESGSGDTVEASRRFVSFAPDSRYLLVVGRRNGEVRAALTPSGHESVTLRRHDEVGRGELYAVRLAGTPVLSWHGHPGPGGAAWPRVVAQARIRHAAYLIGLSQGALDLAVDRSIRRRQFGQPIGKFQAPAFRLAALATRLEAARWLVRAAAWEADQGVDVRLSAAQALSLAADLAGAVVLTAMQVHGAYGLTEGSDVQLYFRRAHLDRVWMGAPAELRRDVYPLLLSADRKDTSRCMSPS
jgi:alkylation response protein AidB-like acyl-CoA dehydrogenase